MQDSTPEQTTGTPQFHGMSLRGVQIEITVCVGQARMSLSDLTKLEPDAVLQLDSQIDDPVEIYIGERLIARGELEESNDNTNGLAVRLTEVANMSDGV